MWKIKENFQYASEHQPPHLLQGQIHFDQHISSYTEFDPLELVIIGNIDDTSRMRNSFKEYEHMEIPVEEDKLPQIVIKTAQEQQEKIVTELLKRGIKVIRTGYVNHSEEFSSNGIRTTGYNNFNARDLIFVYDDSLYEFPSHLHCRKREIKGYEWIEKKLTENGSKVYQAPEHGFKEILYEKEENWEKYKTKIIYGEAANLLRLGLDILFQISSSGSWGCYKLFRKMMEQRYQKKVRVHPIVNVYNGVHIDTTITVLGFNQKIQKYIVLVNGRLVTPKNMPAIFRSKNWAVLEIHDVDVEKIDLDVQVMCSDMIAINMLPINSQLILMSDKQPRLSEIFSYYGIQSLKMPHTYAKHVMGAYHCMSNDLGRKDVHGFRQILYSHHLPKQKLAGLFDPQLLIFLESKADIQNWVEVCNENEIYPTYLCQHMTDFEFKQMEERHLKAMKDQA